MRKFLGFMVMVLFAFPLTVNAEDGEQVVEKEPPNNDAARYKITPALCELE